MSGTRRSSSATPTGYTWSGTLWIAPDPIPLTIQNPAKYLDYAKKEVVAARYYDLPANAVEQAARDQREEST